MTQQALLSAEAKKILATHVLESMKQWLHAISRAPSKRDATLTPNKRWYSHIPSFNDWPIYDDNQLYGSYYDNTGLDVIGSSLLIGKRARSSRSVGLGNMHNRLSGKPAVIRRLSGLDTIGSSLLLGKRAGSRRLTGLDTIGSSLLLGKRAGSRRLSGLDTIGSSLLLGKRIGSRRSSGLDTIGSSLLLGKRAGNR